jgi:tRNA/tmRNA/rRNA uracil-C5-methylase (TrmA/RlmC/RlmD family)
VLFGTVVEVLDPSPDRQPAGDDPACGGRDFAHIAPARQRALKANIVRDTFRRLARLDLPGELPVHESPDVGYRMRARMHVHAARIGFYREGTHTLCDPACSRQLRADTLDVLARVSATLESAGFDGLGSLELAENRDASQRALYLDVAADASRRLPLDALFDLEGVSGFGVSRAGRPLGAVGSPTVADDLSLEGRDGRRANLRLQRHVTGFFQGNRFLVETLVERVLAAVPEGPVTDLYAGAGLFGLAHAALGRGAVLAVESDGVSVEDLRENASPYSEHVQVEARPVEAALRLQDAVAGRAVIVDPPRTGLSREAGAALAASRPSCLVYVSCDVATLARDVGRLAAGGFSVEAVELFDLFPGTAHIETVVALARRD